MDNNEYQALNAMLSSFERLGKVLQSKMKELREELNSMPYEELKSSLKELDDYTLEILCETSGALENEMYEICQAAKELIDERQKNN